MFYLLLLVAGMAIAVRIGDANSPIVECITLPSPVFPSTSAIAAQVTTTPTASVTHEP